MMTCPYSKEENAEAWTAWQCLTQTAVNVFLSGKAGTGKTTFLKKLREASPKRMIVTAPTGVAAINAGGVTIHSFFQLPFAPFIPGTKPKDTMEMRSEKLKIIRTLDLLVIDEISMVRSDLLDAIDFMLRAARGNQLPFGGVQLLMIGDLQQLPPVVTDSDRTLLDQHYATNYFFGSHALAQTTYISVELQTIYRQTDVKFIDILEQIRTGKTTPKTFELLNSRYIPDFDPPQSEGYIRLTTHNATADAQNYTKLGAIKAAEQTYTCTVEGDFPETAFPAPKELKLKIGAQVMFIRNDVQHRYFNGKIGHVVDLTPERVRVRCADDDVEVVVSEEAWTNAHYVVDKQTNEITEQIDGTFKQIPLRLAWAITIHKSQGLTFNKAIIDAQAAFAHGQTYVALSRCRTFEGMVLSSRLDPRSIVSDQIVQQFVSESNAHKVDEGQIENFKADYAFQVVQQMLDFRNINSLGHRILRLFEEHLHRTYPKVILEIKSDLKHISEEVITVAAKFITICNASRQRGDIRQDAQLMQRIAGGAKYFRDKLRSFAVPIPNITDVAVDNKQQAKQLSDLRSQMMQALVVTCEALQAVAQNGFSAEVYLRAKTEAILKNEGVSKQPPKPTSSITAPTDVEHPELYRGLVRWRKVKAADEEVEEYKVLTNKAIVGVCQLLPYTPKMLLSVSGIGKMTADKYGEEVIKIVESYAQKAGIVLRVYDRPVAKPEKTTTTKTATKPPKPVKPPKEPTAEITYRLWKTHGDVDKVARERGLSKSTIWVHLLALVGEGRVDVRDLIGRDRYREVASFVKAQQFDSLSDLFTLGEGRYSYDELRAVIKSLNNEE